MKRVTRIDILKITLSSGLDEKSICSHSQKSDDPLHLLWVEILINRIFAMLLLDCFITLIWTFSLLENTRKIWHVCVPFGNATIDNPNRALSLKDEMWLAGVLGCEWPRLHNSHSQISFGVLREEQKLCGLFFCFSSLLIRKRFRFC